MFRSSKSMEVELKLIFLKRGTMQKRKWRKTGEGARAVGLKGKAVWEDSERLKALKPGREMLFESSPYAVSG